MRDRSDNERDINSLYGCPGADYESSVGVTLLTKVLESYGLSAFTDDFIMMLAARHREEDARSGARADAEYRRNAAA